MNKVCSRCNQSKSLDLFSKRASVKSGYRAECKECAVKITMKWQKAIGLI